MLEEQCRKIWRAWAAWRALCFADLKRVECRRGAGAARCAADVGIHVAVSAVDEADVDVAAGASDTDEYV